MTSNEIFEKARELFKDFGEISGDKRWDELYHKVYDIVGTLIYKTLPKHGFEAPMYYLDHVLEGDKKLVEFFGSMIYAGFDHRVYIEIKFSIDLDSFTHKSDIEENTIAGLTVLVVPSAVNVKFTDRLTLSTLLNLPWKEYVEEKYKTALKKLGIDKGFKK